MTVPTSQWQFATAEMPSVSAPGVFRLRKSDTRAETPVSQQALTWLLFWPLLSLIARQAVYFAGPARTAGAYQSGAAMGGTTGSHLILIVNLLFLLGFALAGYRQTLNTLKRESVSFRRCWLSRCAQHCGRCPHRSRSRCLSRWAFAPFSPVTSAPGLRLSI